MNGGGAGTKRVAIVGAGASGIPAAREALEHGVEPVVFEMSDGIGGLWRFKPADSDEASVMKTTVINTSKEMTAYSTFVPPTQFANFMHNRKMLEYLQLYANSFGFSRFLRLQHTVIDVRRSATYETDGKWLVKYREPDGFECEDVFDAVLLCTGHHTWPYSPPAWPGQKGFRGRVCHAHSYKDARGFDDKTVVVVGVGNSGIDIAVELSRVAAEVRRLRFLLAIFIIIILIHRNLDRSVPFDMLNSRFAAILRRLPVPDSVMDYFLHKLFETHRLDHEKFGLKPKHGLFSAHLTVNDELPNRLCCGSIRVRPNIRQFTQNGVIFEDGTLLEGVDQVILATGYTFEFPLLEAGKLLPVQENDISLFLNIFPPALHSHNTLGIIGLIQPLGSIMPIAEMQARLFFSAFTGAIQMPSCTDMEAHAAGVKEAMHAQFVQSRRHTIQVDYIEYMDTLAELIGCVPRLGPYLFNDPALLKALLFGPNLS
ncbi:Dimethylaniline monooxygenase N-oxide-forming [Globodera pallida]|nr:Dimethylaniline monooxygenase N-oxide-forming [Globodera pallida]